MDDHPLITRAQRLAADLRQLAADADAETLWTDDMDLLVAAMKRVKPSAAAVDAVADVIWVRVTQADMDLRPAPAEQHEDAAAPAGDILR